MMKAKLSLIIAAAAMCSLSSKAQTNVPNYLLASQLRTLTGKIGMPVDSIDTSMLDFEKYMLGFTKRPQTAARETKYQSDLLDTWISFQTDGSNKVMGINCTMPASSLSTAQKAITLLGMTVNERAAFQPGYIAYSNLTHIAFLNPELTKGHLSLVLFTLPIIN